MGLIDNESVPRRTMTLIFMIDTSGSMEGSKIGAVNDAIRNVLPMLKEISDNNPDAEIKIAALNFSSGCEWLYDEPKKLDGFLWQDSIAEGLTSLGEACVELSSKLSRNGFMQSASGSYAPAIILLSDGGPTDDFESGLQKLKVNNWFKSAIKIAIAIGDDADKEVLAKFTGNMEAVITVHNIDALKKIIRIVAIKSSQIGSKSSTAGSKSKQDQVVAETINETKNVTGAESFTIQNEQNNYEEW